MEIDQEDDACIHGLTKETCTMCNGKFYKTEPPDIEDIFNDD